MLARFASFGTFLAALCLLLCSLSSASPTPITPELGNGTATAEPMITQLTSLILYNPSSANTVDDSTVSLAPIRPTDSGVGAVQSAVTPSSPSFPSAVGFTEAQAHATSAAYETRSIGLGAVSMGVVLALVMA